MAWRQNVLFISLIVYSILAGLLSYYQADYISADFVAYVTVARRILEDPAHAITGYWSPLFSWLMVPFLAFGCDDLIAGRVVLLASGVVYLWAVHSLTHRYAGGDQQANFLIRIGVMTCATIQAAQWATYLLDADLVANALLYLYFCVLVSANSQDRLIPFFVCGLLAGATYLAKAYMLPFCGIHFAISAVCFARTTVCRTTRIVRIAIVFISFGVGLGFIAGPWIATLSQKYHKPTFSTAGSANHANMSPENFRKDVLWNPGLTPDFISEPFLNPDWSPFEDAMHFQHQLSLIWYNVSNCIGLVPGWLALLAVSFITIWAQNSRLTTESRIRVVWLIGTSILYCAGYTLVNLEARYITPTVAPLLCMASLILLSRASNAANSSIDASVERGAAATKRISFVQRQFNREFSLRKPIAILVWIVAVSAVDIYGLVQIAIRHPQSVKRLAYQTIATHLIASNIPDQRCGCSDWHFGLYVAYLANRLPNYWGTPLAIEPDRQLEELNLKEIKIYLRFVPDTELNSSTESTSPFLGDRSWIKHSVLRNSMLFPFMCEVYTVEE